MKKIRGVSLFSGAGGMDVGLKKAGVDVVLANEIDSNACDTYEVNHPDSKLLRGDVRDYYDTFAEQKNIDIVFGGPPCQGFSVAGKMDPNDERSKLIWSFLDVVEMVSPRIFIMENVKALGKLEKWKAVRTEFLNRAKEIGYHCQFFILNASEFGVSQNRERVFFIGSKNEYDINQLKDKLDSEKLSPKPIGELLRKLPPAGSEENPITCTAKITLAANPVLRKSPYAGMLFNGMGRPLNLRTVSSTLPASMGGNKTPIVDCKLLDNPNCKNWLEEYHSDLRNDNTSPEANSVPPYLRRLTILETACIQSFPEGYDFRGSKSAVYTQIGNAVPCELAAKVAKAAISITMKDN